MASIADNLRTQQAAPSDESDSVESQLRRIDRQLFDTRREVRELCYRVPGTGTIALGVALGMLLYAIITTLCTIVIVFLLAGALASAASRALDAANAAYRNPGASSQSSSFDAPRPLEVPQ